MTNRIAVIIAAVVFLFADLSPAVGQGQDQKAQAREHFNRGVKLVDAGALTQAAGEFERAYQLSPHYAVLYNLSQVYLALGKPVAAVDVIERYLKLGGHRVPAYRRTRLTKQLEEQRKRIAKLTLRVTPSDATVYLDGREFKSTDLGQPFPIASGPHVLLVSRDGYHLSKREIKLLGGDHRTENVALRAVAPPPPATGYLAIDCPLPGVTLSLGTEQRHGLVFPATLELAVGPHTVRFVRAGYRVSEHIIELRPGKLASLACNMQPLSPLPPALAASVDLDISESFAEVLIDGRPATARNIVPVGSHRIEVRRAGFESWRRQVDIKAGTNNRIAVELRPTLAYSEQHRADAQRQRMWAYVFGGSAIAIGIATVAIAVWNGNRYGDWELEQDQLDYGYGLGPPYSADLDPRQVDNNDLLNSVQRIDQLTVGLGIASGALLVTGIALFAASDNPDRYEGVLVAPQHGGALLGWRAAW